MSTNQELVSIFEQIGAALELLGANSFRVSGNQRVGRAIADMTEDVAAVVAEDPETAVKRLAELPGIGKSSAEKMIEYVRTGQVTEHQELLAKVPNGLFQVLEVPGLGPKAVKLMWEELGIVDLAGLKERLSSEEGIEQIAALPRLGRKKVDGIRKAITFVETAQERIPIGQALPVALELRDTLAAVPGVRRVDYAGSLRRGRETIGDLDFLVAADDPEAVRVRFTTLAPVTDVLARGETKCSVRLASGGVALQADLRLVPQEVYGAALMYFTGSKDHNVRMRQIAIDRGLRLNEYGLFEGTDERPQDRGAEPLASETEEAIFAALGLPWVPPELREDRDELSGTLPKLIELADVRADLHTHTTASDGKLPIEAMAEAAKARGYHTLAITDHSQSQVLANGLTPDRLLSHVEAIREADARIDGITLVAGAEVDILPDGSLDYDDDVLAQLDIVVASPHAALNQEPAPSTERLLRAIRHPLVHIIGHPTGRMVTRREGLSPDMAALFAAAAEHDTALELNSNWQRLDLRDTHLRAALAAGCKIAIDTDAHRAEHFDLLVYGILTARRAGLEPASCLNTWPAEKLRAWLKSKR